MKRPVAPPDDAKPAVTILARMRPTVVVRRRVVDAPTGARGHVDGDDEDGPPSSVNVARALASLRADELHRLEQILSDDEERPIVADEEPAPLSVPVVRLGLAISVAELARRLGVSAEELVTACVTNGFFSVTVKTLLPRDTARAAAALFGWQAEDDDAAESAPPATAKRASAKKTKTSPKASARAKAAAPKSAKAKRR